MDIDTDKIAEAIHDKHPVRVDGTPLRWDEVVRSHPGRADEYRAAAKNRLRVELAMVRLKEKASLKASA